MSGQPIRALFALDDDVETTSFEHSLVGGPSLQIVGIVSGLEAGWRSIEETSPDLLVLVARRVSDKQKAWPGWWSGAFPIEGGALMRAFPGAG